MNVTQAELISVENPVFCAYLTYSSILILKVLGMVLLIGRYRFQKRIFISPEDTKIIPGSKVALDDPDIERCRRAHLNDIENIPFFLVGGLFYTLTNPNEFVAINLFRIFTASRVLHTFVYAIVVIPQPARVIFFAIADFINVYMAFSTIVTFFKL